jgi:preprotein translocase subunit SecA
MIDPRERRSSPYRERAERDLGLIDRALLAGQEKLERRLPFRRLRLGWLADRVIAREEALSRLSDEALRDAADSLRPRLLRGGFETALVEEAFALVREACGRALGKRHYRVQLMGGAAMLEGWLAEMATGEGKTLTAALPACVAALAGLPVHVVTVNEYLAERDAGILAPAYALLGLTVGFNTHGQSPDERRAAYAADITHTANNELVFDYLKDKLAMGHAQTRAARAIAFANGAGQQPQLLMRGLGLAVVDEADSVLVDEARTPLIISAEVEADEDARCRAALALARSLGPRHFVVLEDQRQVTLTHSGREHVATVAPVDGHWLIPRAREELVEQALQAIHLFKRDEHYVVAEGEVQIVDEFTGRIAEGRKWERGLHQMIEVKEGVEATSQRDARARMTYQRFFRRYLKLCGMSGTVRELAGEMRAIYALPVATIPPHRTSRRRTLPAELHPNAASKWHAVAESAVRIAATGRPVLIGTRSVAASESVSRVLSSRDVDHQVLNARHDKAEADIIAAAGQAGRITVATNMAGRGTDIHLDPAAREAGGLHVILTELHESSRIDRQLIGRGARQGDPGSWQGIVARDDDLFRRFAPAWMRAAAPLDVLRLVCQALAEAQNASARRMAQKQESQDRERLAFAGAPE